MGSAAPATGVWVDSKTGRLVRSEPEHGIQIVPEGGEITPDAQAQIDLYSAIAEPETPVKAPEKTVK